MDKETLTLRHLCICFHCSEFHPWWKEEVKKISVSVFTRTELSDFRFRVSTWQNYILHCRHNIAIFVCTVALLESSSIYFFQHHWTHTCTQLVTLVRSFLVAFNLNLRKWVCFFMLLCGVQCFLALQYNMNTSYTLLAQQWEMKPQRSRLSEHKASVTNWSKSWKERKEE